MHHVYDDYLPGENWGSRDDIEDGPEDVATAHPCPVHGREYLYHDDDGHVVCRAPCSSVPDYLCCPWREELPDRDHAAVKAAADAIGRGDPPPDGPGWLQGCLDDLALDVGATRHLTDDEAENV